MYRTQSRAHGPCCSSSRICLPVTRAGSGSCVRRGARRRPAVPLLTLPGLDACPLEGAELPVRRRRGADATRPRVGEGRGATHPTDRARAPPPLCPTAHPPRSPGVIQRRVRSGRYAASTVPATQETPCKVATLFYHHRPQHHLLSSFLRISASGTARFQNSTVKATPVASVSWLTG